MKIEKRSSNKERLILIAMIVDITVLGRISSKWQRNMFKSKWANIVAQWCVAFYQKYEDVPMNQIESIFESWAEETNNKEVIALVEKFLDSLSEEYEDLQSESNSDYIIDVAGEYFNQVSIERLTDIIQGDVDRGKVTKAVNRVSSFNQIEMGVGEGIDILQDTEAIKEAFKDKEEPLITYPGALGKFFKDALERDGFIAFMGPDKVGKSFWLLDIAYRAMLQRKKVAFFEVGDMSQNQVMRRLMVRVAQRPIYEGLVEYPVKIIKNKDENTCVEAREKRYKGKLSWKEAKKACKKLMRKKIKSKHSYFRLSCHPNTTLSVSGIQDTIQNWIREDWIPDVIVIDYADILNMDHQGLEGRDRTNETWKRLRSLSQIFHCLVVTASQTDANAYKTGIITRGNFSEDKRKLAHVTGMIGINMNNDEKKEGLTRLNWVVLREGAFTTNKCVYVASCLPLANPAVKSTF